MRVLVLGAGGIIGQTMRLYKPMGVNVLWQRRKSDMLHVGCDLENIHEVESLLDEYEPDVIVNLAGENNVDAVERDFYSTSAVNVGLVETLMSWCRKLNRRLIQISSQAVFRGLEPPYRAEDPTDPVNLYGVQKVKAELAAKKANRWMILRPTFVCGIRPMPLVGRFNPAESMLSGQASQVNDRWFSVLFARDAARLIWMAVQNERNGAIVNMGCRESMSRYTLAQAMGLPVRQVSHADFPELAARPMDTTYADSAALSMFRTGIEQVLEDWKDRGTGNVNERAREISMFFGIPESAALDRLKKGFLHQHQAINADYRQANPKSDDAILDWYRKTTGYVWELSAYHTDAGFNYNGMVSGIVESLRARSCRKVLCLGDGIGDLTLALIRNGFDAVYHDLQGSVTAQFAAFRFWLHHPEPVPMMLTDGWSPDFVGAYDAVVSCDFLEHVTDVPAWVQAINRVLLPGGYLMAQNAFGIGSEGSIPMHLQRNDRFEKDWDPMLSQMGMHQLCSNWYQRMVACG